MMTIKPRRLLDLIYKSVVGEATPRVERLTLNNETDSVYSP